MHGGYGDCAFLAARATGGQTPPRELGIEAAPLVRAVANHCLTCTKLKACWACVFSDYHDDVVLELERRRLSKVVSMAEAREQLFRSVASRAGVFPPQFSLN